MRLDGVSLVISARPKSEDVLSGQVGVEWNHGAVREPDAAVLRENNRNPVIAVIPAKLTLSLRVLTADNNEAFHASVSVGALFNQHFGLKATDERVALEGNELARLVLPLANREMKNLLFRADLPPAKIPGDLLFSDDPAAKMPEGFERLNTPSS